LRWFEHVQQRIISVLIRRSDRTTVTGETRTIGRPEKLGWR